MWATILPFLLVANVTIDDRYQGPPWPMYNLEYEYTFQLVLNSSVTKEDNTYCRNVVAELKCRSIESDSLTCYIDNGRKGIITGGGCTHKDRSHPEFEDFRKNDDLFEVRFSEEGIEDLIVSKNTDIHKVEIIKEVVRQLDIGLTISDKDLSITQGLFTVDDMDHITIPHINKKDYKKLGYNCDYDGTLIRIALDSKENDSTKGENLHLAFVSLSDERPQQIGGMRAEKWRLIKQRQINTCSPIFFFATDIGVQDSYTAASVRQTASVRDIIISKNRFMSSTTSQGRIHTSISRFMIIKQRLSIELKRINIVNNPLPEIKDPVPASCT